MPRIQIMNAATPQRWLGGWVVKSLRGELGMPRNRHALDDSHGPVSIVNLQFLPSAVLWLCFRLVSEGVG